MIPLERKNTDFSSFRFNENKNKSVINNKLGNRKFFKFNFRLR